ncbi:hypothetical protein [Spongiivirga citrea]|uniref:Uncharacterized protein n=1 Tax=Spongiivirga citrea TaxID=1481457 RepID=A0A6M0CJC8_9FLAO|nr:hypothetical protein [Spongiivirga citrea]NER16094.1 hypothetical protein [Spongiivirga citrea]
MDILKIAIEWAKAEVFSSRFFILFAILFLTASIGFWQLGKTGTAKAYIIPTLVAGVLLLAVGLGIFFTNKSRVTSFAEAYNTNPTEFVQSEIIRTEKSMGEYRIIVFKVIPMIIIVAALLIVVFDKPLWRAISITTIAMMVAILLVDSNANSRIENYHKQLELVDE